MAVYGLRSPAARTWCRHRHRHRHRHRRRRRRRHRRSAGFRVVASLAPRWLSSWWLPPATGGGCAAARRQSAPVAAWRCSRLGGARLTVPVTRGWPHSWSAPRSWESAVGGGLQLCSAAPNRWCRRPAARFRRRPEADTAAEKSARKLAAAGETTGNPLRPPERQGNSVGAVTDHWAGSHRGSARRGVVSFLR